MLGVRCAAVEFNFCSLVLSIMLAGGAGGMTDARRVTHAVYPSLIASWFFVNYPCSL